MGFQVTACELGCIVVLDAAGRLTLEDGRTRLRDFVHVLVNSGHRNFLVNLAGVDFIDSYGIGELARCYNVVRRMGGEIRLVYVNRKVHHILQITKLDTLFEIHSEEKAALQLFPRRA